MTNSSKNRIKDRIFNFIGIFATLIGIIILGFFIGSILYDGLTRIDWDFLNSLPSRKAEKAGILTAWSGSLWIVIFTFLLVVPLGIAAGIYLEEYGNKSKLSSLLEVNISNLAGVPSVIYGLLGLEIFVRLMNLGSSILAGSFTLALLVLPIIIVATREPVTSFHQRASYGLGATKWQTCGISTTRFIWWYSHWRNLSISRQLEKQPLIVIGMLCTFHPFIPMDEFTVLPIQIFNWILVHNTNLQLIAA